MRPALFLIAKNIEAAILDATQVQKNEAVRRGYFTLYFRLRDLYAGGQVWSSDILSWRGVNFLTRHRDRSRNPLEETPEDAALSAFQNDPCVTHSPTLLFIPIIAPTH